MPTEQTPTVGPLSVTPWTITRLDEHLARFAGVDVVAKTGHTLAEEVLLWLSIETRLNQLQWWGDDSEWIAAEGHVPLGQFAADADGLAMRDAGVSADEVPSSAGNEPDTYVRFVGSDEERFEWCTADAEGARPCTVVDTQ